MRGYELEKEGVGQRVLMLKNEWNDSCVSLQLYTDNVKLSVGVYFSVFVHEVQWSNIVYDVGSMFTPICHLLWTTH